MERLVRRVVVLAVLLLVLPCFVALMSDLVRTTARSVPTPAVGFPGCLVLGGLSFLFVVGLFVRVLERLTHRDPGSARRRTQAERRAALSERRPVEDVPVDEPPRPERPDHDPPLPWE